MRHNGVVEGTAGLKLPLGAGLGKTGQSDADGDLVWGIDPPNAPIAGRSADWLRPDGVLGTLQGAADGVAAFVPVRLPAGAVDQLACDVSTAGTLGGLARLGLYADAGGRPGALLRDAGTVAANATGIRTITLASAIAVSGGLYWLVLATQGGALTRPTYRTITTGLPIPVPAPVTNVTPLGWSATGVTGALPATGTAVTLTATATPFLALARMGTVT